MAVGSALRAPGVAGHLRHVRCLAALGDGQVRWVTRTYWSRTTRDNEWWNIRLQAEGNPESPAPLAIPAPASSELGPVRALVPSATPAPLAIPAPASSELGPVRALVPSATPAPLAIP
ncbi:MarR family transcriptional regulator, partial [Streptomyces sp. NPDC060035]